MPGDGIGPEIVASTVRVPRLADRHYSLGTGAFTDALCAEISATAAGA